jgi:hypothetical protein
MRCGPWTFAFCDFCLSGPLGEIFSGFLVSCVCVTKRKKNLSSRIAKLDLKKYSLIDLLERKCIPMQLSSTRDLVRKYIS